MAFYKRLVVHRRDLMQLQEQLLRYGKMAAPLAPRRSKFVCYRCGRYFQTDDLPGMPVHRKDVTCPHCLYKFVPLSRKPQIDQQPTQQRMKVCKHCRCVYTLSEEQHLSICQSLMVKCGECHKQVPRRQLNDHRSKCPLCRCYRCNMLLYKRCLPEHLLGCGRQSANAAQPRLSRRQAAPKVAHVYHFRNKQQAAPEVEVRKMRAAAAGPFSPVPVSIENWLRK